MWINAGGTMKDPLLRDLEKLNAELKLLANYQVLLERRINKVFRRLEKKIEREMKQ
jgi:N-methylhydantoinase A/oxoprolinase/acetone carboxylase beta subunit